MKIKYTFLKLRYKLFSKRYVAGICKHETKGAGEISAFDETQLIKMPLNDGGVPDFCLDCISKMAIQCAWCGEPITIGSPIALYTPSDLASVKLDLKIHQHNDDPNQFVGCLRWDCAECGGDRAGFWYPDTALPFTCPRGRVHRVASPIEMMLQSSMDGGGRGAVVVVDLNDPKNTGKLIDVE